MAILLSAVGLAVLLGLVIHAWSLASAFSKVPQAPYEPVPFDDELEPEDSWDAGWPS